VGEAVAGEADVEEGEFPAVEGAADGAFAVAAGDVGFAGVVGAVLAELDGDGVVAGGGDFEGLEGDDVWIGGERGGGGGGGCGGGR
jgi:hypothetical protein